MPRIKSVPANTDEVLMEELLLLCPPAQNFGKRGLAWAELAKRATKRLTHGISQAYVETWFSRLPNEMKEDIQLDGRC
jgi:hypothetical protein